MANNDIQIFRNSLKIFNILALVYYFFIGPVPWQGQKMYITSSKINIK